MRPRPRENGLQRQEPVADTADPVSWDWSRPIYDHVRLHVRDLAQSCASTTPCVRRSGSRSSTRGTTSPSSQTTRYGRSGGRVTTREERLEEAAQLYECTAAELRTAAAQCETSARHLRDADVPRGGARVAAASAERELNRQAQTHASTSTVSPRRTGRACGTVPQSSCGAHAVRGAAAFSQRGAGARRPGRCIASSQTARVSSRLPLGDRRSATHAGPAVGISPASGAIP